MARTQKSTALYPHPFSKAYWRDAASELKDIKMLVVTALMIALRIALKPFAIYIGPQMAIQTATLATALGAMIFGPVVAIPAAIISDTIGFMIFPTGDYFLPFVLTEIASTMIYALCFYRAKPSATRVIIARFLICFVVNVVLQQLIFAWQYTYLGNPETHLCKPGGTGDPGGRRADHDTGRAVQQRGARDRPRRRVHLPARGDHARHGGGRLLQGRHRTRDLPAHPALSLRLLQTENAQVTRNRHFFCKNLEKLLRDSK